MFLLHLLLTLSTVPARASEADALAISANIQAKHLPFGTILDPIYASSTSNQIVGYTRCGDSALWTGAYLAAEAFRYKVTQSPDALSNAQKAIAGLKGLADVTGTNLLARCIVQANSPYAQGIASEEVANGVNKTPTWLWVGNTSRDQFIGVIFGLGAAYDLIDDAATKTSISDLVTRLTSFLTGNDWSIVMPDGTITTTFLIRPDELLAVLEVANHVNSSKFSTYYTEQKILLELTVPAPIAVDIASDDSYFKFNLGYMCFYNLLRLDNADLYNAAYSLLRAHTQPQQNAFFEIVDRALSGPNTARDAETRSLLEQWLQRPKRDPFTDATKSVANCGNQACFPIPLLLRPPGDFLWQISPYQLSGGGSGVIEGAGIDYILPYWMARYYGVITPSAVTSSAATTTSVAPGSFATLFGSNLATVTAQASILPLPASLGGATLKVTDAAGVARPAGLVYASPSQINFVVPDGTSPGIATFAATSSSTTQTFTATVQGVVPTLFSMSSTGTGVAAATAVQVQAANPQLQGPVAVFQCALTGGCTSVPIALGIDTPIYVSFYGTGIRGRTALTNVHLVIGGTSVPVLYAGPQPSYPGLDQVNVLLPLSLRGAGESNVVLTVDGQVSNTVTINVK
jgi:uncharacterized protein (TIGR03437 family)